MFFSVLKFSNRTNRVTHPNRTILGSVRVRSVGYFFTLYRCSTVPLHSTQDFPCENTERSKKNGTCIFTHCAQDHIWLFTSISAVSMFHWIPCIFEALIWSFWLKTTTYFSNTCCKIASRENIGLAIFVSKCQINLISSELNSHFKYIISVVFHFDLTKVYK